MSSAGPSPGETKGILQLLHNTVQNLIKGIITPKTLEGSSSVKGDVPYLEDGVHDAGKRSVVGVFRHGEDVQTPFVEVLQLLGQQLLLVGLDAEARDAAAGERGPVGDLLDPADLCHQLLLLLLLLLPRL